MAWLAFGVPLLFYIPALSSDAAFWDTGEMQTVPYILGIAHPTGFPFFTLAGWLFSHVVPFGTPAWRLALMCAIAMAAAACAACMLARELGADARVAVAAAWLFAASEVAWSRGTRVEVHALAVMFAMLAIARAVRFRKKGEIRALYGCALWLGLGLADHPVVALTIPGLLIVLSSRYKTLFGGAGLRACAILLACVSLYLYLPLRSAYAYEHRLDPTLSLGIPPGRPYWDYGHPSTWENFKREVLGEDFKAGGTLARAFAPERYGAMSLAYARRADKEVGLFVVCIALIGVLFMLRDDPGLSVGILLAGGAAVPFALNYKVESDVDRYFLTSYATIAACAAVGLQRASQRLPPESRPAAVIVSALLLLGFAVHTASSNGMNAAYAHKQASANAWIERVRSKTPSDALIIADWEHATPLAYGAYVERRLDRRIVETAWIQDDQEYLGGWLRRFPVYVASSESPELPGYRFDLIDDASPALYRVRAAVP